MLLNGVILPAQSVSTSSQLKQYLNISSVCTHVCYETLINTGETEPDGLIASFTHDCDKHISPWLEAIRKWGFFVYFQGFPFVFIEDTAVICIIDL